MEFVCDFLSLVWFRLVWVVRVVWFGLCCSGLGLFGLFGFRWVVWMFWCGAVLFGLAGLVCLLWVGLFGVVWFVLA